MQDPRDIEIRLLGAVRDRLGVEARIDDRLSALGVDSLRLADFVSDLERIFHIQADPEIFDVQTLRDLAQYIRERS